MVRCFCSFSIVEGFGDTAQLGPLRRVCVSTVVARTSHEPFPLAVFVADRRQFSIVFS